MSQRMTDEAVVAKYEIMAEFTGEVTKISRADLSDILIWLK